MAHLCEKYHIFQIRPKTAHPWKNQVWFNSMVGASFSLTRVSSAKYKSAQNRLIYVKSEIFYKSAQKQPIHGINQVWFNSVVGASFSLTRVTSAKSKSAQNWLIYMKSEIFYKSAQKQPIHGINQVWFNSMVGALFSLTRVTSAKY